MKYGPAATMMQKMGWEPGQELGRNAEPVNGAVETPALFSAASHPQFFSSLAWTRRKEDMQSRVKRRRDSTFKPVCFTKGEVLPSTIKPIAISVPFAPEPVLTWQQLVDALIQMTEFGFSKSGLVHMLDSLSENHEQHQFSWQSVHFQLSRCHCLPPELECGMKNANNGDEWESTMQALLNYQTYDWRLMNEYFLQYRMYISRLWKTLEIAMNNAGVDVAFCVFVCHKVMEACKVTDCGCMYLTPVLEPTTTSGSQQPQRFLAKMRYRAKGRDPKERFGRMVSYSQLKRGDNLRPFLAAQGIAPPV